MRSKRDIYAIVLVFGSVVGAYLATTSTAQTGTQPAQVADNEYQAGATLWTQKAAEYRALAYQAFNIARMRLDADLDRRNLKRLPGRERRKPRAIVVDIDETVLDNSPAQAAGIRARKPFSLPDWYAWGEMRKAKAVPGAVEFLNYAGRKGVKVFYVSNRDDVPQRQTTIDNLKNAGFNDVTVDNVLLRIKDAEGNNVSTKTPRRDQISRRYRIVLLMGDNLDDFSDVFERRSVADRFAETDKARAEWGSRWIVLPNPMYGTWENALYDYQRLTEAQKTEKRNAAFDLP
jgi:5'-nucleotidase (lipoprotein e(P4) family)